MYRMSDDEGSLENSNCRVYPLDWVRYTDEMGFACVRERWRHQRDHQEKRTCRDNFLVHLFFVSQMK